MRSPSRLVAGLSGLLCVVLVSAIARGQGYKVRISQPEKVGNKFSISSTATEKMSSSVALPGVPPQEMAYTLDLDGTVEVLAVNDKTAQPTKLSCTVAKCTRDGEKVYDAGAIITADSTGGHPVITVNGNEADAHTTEQLTSILQTHKPGDSEADDKMFGTDQPQKVGNSWPVNSEAVAKAFSEQGDGLPISKDDVSGTVKLVSVQKVEGKEYLEVVADLDVKNIHGQSNGANIESGSMTGHMTALLPADEGARPLDDSMSMKMKMTAKAPGPNGQDLTVSMNVQRDVKTKISEAGK